MCVWGGGEGLGKEFYRINGQWFSLRCKYIVCDGKPIDSLLATGAKYLKIAINPP